jgi:hypothetical protein
MHVIWKKTITKGKHVGLLTREEQIISSTKTYPKNKLWEECTF